MKRKYAERKNSAKNLASFKRIWKNIGKKIWQDCGNTLMVNVKKKLRIIGREGVYATFN